MDIGCSAISEAGGVGLCFPEAIARLFSNYLRIPYVGKFWCGKKLANLVNRMPFANVLHAYYLLL